MAGRPRRTGATARDALARAAAGASGGRYEQIRFAEALPIADDALGVLGDAPVADRVALARLRAREGLDNDYAALALEARAIAGPRRGGGHATPTWRSRRAASRSRSRASAGATSGAGLGRPGRRGDAARPDRRRRRRDGQRRQLDFDDDRAAAFDRLERARGPRGGTRCTTALGWVGQTRTELWLATGDWDRASAAGRAAVELGGRARLPPDRRAHDGGRCCDRPRDRRDRETLGARGRLVRALAVDLPRQPVRDRAPSRRRPAARGRRGSARARRSTRPRLAEGIALSTTARAGSRRSSRSSGAAWPPGTSTGARRALERYDVPPGSPVAERRVASVALCRAWVLARGGPRRTTARAAARRRRSRWPSGTGVAVVAPPRARGRGRPGDARPARRAGRVARAAVRCGAPPTNGGIGRPNGHRSATFDLMEVRALSVPPAV